MVEMLLGGVGRPGFEVARGREVRRGETRAERTDSAGETNEGKDVHRAKRYRHTT